MFFVILFNKALFNKKHMKKILYGKAVYDKKEINAVVNVLKNQSLSLIDGKNVKKLEKATLTILASKAAKVRVKTAKKQIFSRLRRAILNFEFYACLQGACSNA